MKRNYRPNQNSQFLLDVRPETAQWKYISFKVARLAPGEKMDADTSGEEIVIVPRDVDDICESINDHYKNYERLVGEMGGSEFCILLIGLRGQAARAARVD